MPGGPSDPLKPEVSSRTASVGVESDASGKLRSKSPTPDGCVAKGWAQALEAVKTRTILYPRSYSYEVRPGPSAATPGVSPMHNPFLIGRSVYLRPLEREDAALVQPWMNDPDVNRTMRTHGPLSLCAEQAYIDKLLQNEHACTAVIVRRDVDQAIGLCGLHQIDFQQRHCIFGITIGDKDAWGMGFGTEATFLMVQHAFETMNLNRVALQVYEYNQRGLRAYEKVGFRKEGVLRQENYREGRYWDTILMAMLRQEWDEAKARFLAAAGQGARTGS
jgi:RimJ/RimL family protein N-acetyltransferase